MPPDDTSKTSPGPSPRRNKKQKFSKASRQDHEASAEGRSTVHSDPFHAHATADPQAGTAAIHPVTAETLDEAAHKAAQLADGVAHHTIPAAESAIAKVDEGSAAVDDATDTIRETVTTAITEVEGAAPLTPDKPPEPGEETAPRDAAAGGLGPDATLARYGDKVMEIMQGNIAASAALLSALSQAKSLPEAVAINSDHMRRHLTAMTAQGRELATLAQKLGLDALKPLAGILRRRD